MTTSEAIPMTHEGGVPMTSKEERREAAWTRAKTRLESYLNALEMARSGTRAQVQKARAQRRRQVGKLAEQHGLCTWSDADLRACFEVLSRLSGTPHPAGVLEGCLDPSLTGPLVAGNGYAHATHVVPSSEGIG